MAEPGWPANVLSVGIFEFRRSVRDIWADKARFALMTLGVMVPSLMAAVFAVIFSDPIRGVDALPEPDLFRGWVALFWLFAVFLLGQRVVSARSRIDAESLMLTTVSARTVAGGMVVAETLRILAYLAPPVLVLTGVGVGLLGAPVSLVVVPVAAALFAVTAVVAAAVAGYAVAWLVATSRFVARHRTVLASVASLAGTGLYLVFFFPQISGITPELLAPLPIAWLLDLALLGTGLAEAPLRAGGAVVVSLAVLGAGGVAIEHETVALWFSEPVSVDSEDTTETTASATDGDLRRDPLAAAIAPLAVPEFVSTPVRRVAEWALLRTRRDPNRLTFILIPVIAMSGPLATGALEAGAIGTVATPVFAVVLPWLAGALFAMNPLGDEGRLLPITLTAVSGRQYVRGLVLPSLLFGLPVVVALTALGGVFSPYSPSEHVGLVVLGVYLTCVAATITPAIGMTLPRFSAISVGQSRDVLPPRMAAVVVHAGLTTVPGGVLAALVIAPAAARTGLAGLFGFLPAISLQLLSRSDGGVLIRVGESFANLGEVIQSIGLARLQLVGGGLLLLGGVLVAVMLYLNAIGRFERYSPV
ncbi:hypothetical protein ACFQH2_06540 [Natronoarchaeum sp. GCM10025703]|uniref:hypothetical protein n=1 Tax=unclassified Natronoarchaeum TaxID=2620183 RepID=UPI00361BD9CC